MSCKLKDNLLNKCPRILIQDHVSKGNVKNFLHALPHCKLLYYPSPTSSWCDPTNFTSRQPQTLMFRMQHYVYPTRSHEPKTVRVSIMVTEVRGLKYLKNKGISNIATGRIIYRIRIRIINCISNEYYSHK